MKDPVQFSLDYHPRKWQYECHKNFKRFNVIVVHRQAGKSEFAAVKLIESAVMATSRLPMFMYLSPHLKQSKTNMWARLKFLLRDLIAAGDIEVSEQDHSVQFKHNAAIIRLFGANDPDSLRGPTLDGVVVDETAQVPGTVWDEILQPMLMAKKGWAAFIGTPKGVNLLSRVFEYGQNRPDWFVHRWTVYETEAFSAKEIEERREAMPPRLFASEFLCDFNAGTDDQIIPLSLATEASHRIFHPNDRLVLASPVILGVDPARFGVDRSVIFRRQGLLALPPKVFRGIDNMDLAARVAVEINEHQPAAVFVDAGGGGGVIDRLRQLGHTVIEVPFGGAALTKGYANRRVEMWFGVKKWLENGGAIPNDADLVRELATPVYWFNRVRDLLVMEAKDEIKARLPDYGSPDLADALALTFAAPVAANLGWYDERLTSSRQVVNRYYPLTGQGGRR